MSDHFEPDVYRTMVEQVAHAIEEGRPYLIGLPHGGRAEFLRAVADCLGERDDPGVPQGGHAHLPGVPCSWCSYGHPRGGPEWYKPYRPVGGVGPAMVQRIYEQAQQHDPWPGESYGGTSLRDLREHLDRNHPFGEFDAQVWAREFAERFETEADTGTLISWFANAIMTGYDEGRRRAQLDLHELTMERQRFGRVEPVEVDEEGNVTDPGPLEPESESDDSWVDYIADALAEHYGLEPSDRKWPDATVEGTPEDLAGVVYRALASRLAELERAAHPLREAQAWGEAQQVQRRAEELEHELRELREENEALQRVRSLAWDLMRQHGVRHMTEQRLREELEATERSGITLDWPDGGEAQQAQARVAELEQSVADLAEGLERAEKALADCWRLRGLAETIARQRIPNERPSAWTHVRRDTMNELRRYLGIDLEAEERERQEHMEYAEWQQEQEADARSTRLGEETDDAIE